MAYDYGKSSSKGNSTRIGTQNRNSGVYTRTVFGNSIRENRVPTETADKERHPFVIFKDPKTGKRIGMSRHMLSLGCLALAAPGGGKTNLFDMMLDGLLEDFLSTPDCEDIIGIVDTKGDYLERFGHRIPEADKIVIGCGERYRNITGYHNIFAEIMPRGLDGKLVYVKESDEDALEISKQLFQDMHSDPQPVFPAMAKAVFAGIMIYFMRTYWSTDQSKLNNRELINFIQSKTNEELKAVFELDYMQDQRSCISYLAGKSSMTQGVSAYIGVVLREMFVGPFAKADPAREYSMREIVKGNRKKVVFLEYDMVKGNILSPMYGMQIDQVLKYGLGGREGSRKNVYLLLDEMAVLPKLMHASDGLSFGRSQGVKVMAGLQNISAVEEVYGEAGARNILAGFQNIFAFKITDYATRRFMVERLGENYQNNSFSAQNENANVQRNGHTLEEWDLLNMGLGECIVSLAEEKPFMFTMPKYRK